MVGHEGRLSRGGCSPRQRDQRLVAVSVASFFQQVLLTLPASCVQISGPFAAGRSWHKCSTAGQPSQPVLTEPSCSPGSSSDIFTTPLGTALTRFTSCRPAASSSATRCPIMLVLAAPAAWPGAGAGPAALPAGNRSTCSAMPASPFHSCSSWAKLACRRPSACSTALSGTCNSGNQQFVSVWAGAGQPNAQRRQ